MTTRKSDGATSTLSPAKAAANLKHLRAQIDRLDLQILKLINERAGLAADIGRVKNDHGSEVFSPAREEEVLKNVFEAHEKAKGPLDFETVRAVFRELMSGSRALQKVLKVAYLGPEYSYSYLAAVERFGQKVDLIKVGSIAAVFEDVNRGQVDFGVVPLENSTDGRVADTLDMFLRLPQIKIVAEIRVRIHHCLMARPDMEQQEIRRVYSKEQALSQCRTWLSKNLAHAQQITVSSTTVAADTAQKEPGAAAIASRQAAVKYGLRILFENIEDSPYNETRFAVVSLQKEKSAKSGGDKTAVMFRVPHQPGSLVEALDVFKQNKINLTWIESFPAKLAKPEYVFFVDFEGHVDDPKVSRALKALQEQCQEVNVLGSFPMAMAAG
ncbi:MAG TPA: prephenate dehydratase [Gemmataceae bacterium]|nr:prephenate dehydratase [Gemmataceae bacterium]